jgi:hypothetical protein
MFDHASYSILKKNTIHIFFVMISFNTKEN